MWSLYNQSSGWILMFSLGMIFSSPWHLKSILMQMLRQNCHCSIGLVPSNSPIVIFGNLFFILAMQRILVIYENFHCLNVGLERECTRLFEPIKWGSIYYLPFYVYWHGIHMVSQLMKASLLLFFFQKPSYIS